MKDKGKKNNDIAQHIFIGAATMIGVCITVISLFRITKAGKTTSADELLGVNTLIFIISCFLSYLCLRNPDIKYVESVADILFFIGLLLMLVVGFMIVFTTY